MDASEIYSKRLNAKEVIFPKEGEFTFPIADGRIKLPWRRSGAENIHLGTASTNSRRKSESEGSLPPPHDSFPDAEEAINDFWSMSGNFMYSFITLNQESNFTRREKNHSLFH